VRVPIIPVALLLAGCASSATQRDSELDRFKGQDIHVLLSRLGDPQRQDVISGDTVYLWSASKPVQSIPTTPAIAIQSGAATSVTAPPPVVRNMQMTCTLAADTNASGKILQLRWSGDRNACPDYVQELAP
jgi:hypothetical protein